MGGVHGASTASRRSRMCSSRPAHWVPLPPLCYIPSPDVPLVQYAASVLPFFDATLTLVPLCGRVSSVSASSIVQLLWSARRRRCVRTCSPMLLCLGLQRVGLYDDLASYGRELLRVDGRGWSSISVPCVVGRLPLVVLVLLPFPAQHSFPPASVRCQHYCLADQDCFGSPASCSASTSRCQHSLLSCQHFNFSCAAGVPTASVCGFSQCVV
jgi:hypothetical protein